jgi:hypothetical protein
MSRSTTSRAETTSDHDMLVLNHLKCPGLVLPERSLRVKGQSRDMAIVHWLFRRAASLC